MGWCGRYGGCGGNGNNFKTGANCQKNCGGSLEAEQGAGRGRGSQRGTQQQPSPGETGLRRRKMKRVRISPKDGASSSTKARGGSRFNSQELEERSLLLDSDDTDNDDRDSVLAQAETRATLNRARLRSRTPAADTVITSSSGSGAQTVNIENLRQSFRRPARTISNLTAAPAAQQQYPRERQDAEKVAGPRVSPGRVLHRARKIAVDAVMKAPPHMKSGLVVIRSYCRHPPEEVRRQHRCRSPATFYYYNVSTATCEAASGVCTASSNNFPSFEACMQTCIVNKDQDQGEE